MQSESENGGFAAVPKACGRAEIPRWTPGQLRKTRATQARQQGDLETAQQVLGHSSKQTTERHFPHVDLSRAEFERTRISERTSAAMAHLKSLNQRVGKFPFGHDLSDDGSTLVENPREQAAIELIHLLRESGMNYARVADLLNRKKLPTKGQAGKLESKTVMRIVRRTAA